MNGLIFSCTKGNVEDTLLYNSWEKYDKIIRVNLPILFEDNNTKGLSECYNNIIKSHAEYLDYIILCHDDVILQDTYIIDKIEAGLKEFDVLGVAGSSIFSINRLPICWHNSPQDSWRGGLYHPEINTNIKTDFSNINDIYYTCFGKNGQCSVMDGVFLVVKPKQLVENNIFFDNQFTFDFYDTDFSINCITNALTLGTIPVSIIHNSHGAGIQQDRYKDFQNKFIKKWKKNV